MARGDTVGVFQLESSGMRDVLRKLKPDRFEDIIALVALYRPGPMDEHPELHQASSTARSSPTICIPARADPEGDLRHHRSTRSR